MRYFQSISNERDHIGRFEICISVSSSVLCKSWEQLFNRTPSHGSNDKMLKSCFLANNACAKSTIISIW